MRNKFFLRDFADIAPDWHRDTLICTWSEVMPGKSFVPVSSLGGDVSGFREKVSDDIDPL